MTSLLPRVASLLAVCGPAAAAFADAAAPAAPTPPEAPPAAVPFAFADFTWLNGNSRTKDSPLQTKAFTGEFRADTSYIFDFAHPKDHTLGGTSESGRTDEFQVQQLGIGGDFHYDNMIGRLMTQFGMYSTMTPRNDASPVVGQWGLADAYRYISEAYGDRRRRGPIAPPRGSRRCAGSSSSTCRTGSSAGRSCCRNGSRLRYRVAEPGTRRCARSRKCRRAYGPSGERSRRCSWCRRGTRR